MKYQLIALDLDDTLLNHEKRISFKNREAVSDAKRKGAHIVIATGRAYGAATQFQEALGLQDYLIHIGGALIADPDGTIVYGEFIDPSSVRGILNWADKHGVYFQVYTDRDYRYREYTDHTAAYEEAVEFRGIHDPDLLTRDDLPVSKILLIDAPEKIAAYKDALSTLFPELSFETSMDRFLEISSRRASKGNALKWIAEQLQIPRSEVMAFGDSGIDRSMIEYAGLGVAMANARGDVRKAADAVVPSNEEDGVAWGLEHYCFNQ